jgi:peptidoglycan/xylan/chitin deacetylase (PgdA/CDA1 family)
LIAVMYHYIRDFPRTRFPRLNGLTIDAFRDQLDVLSDRFELATLESGLAFLAGRYQPDRDLCLLTFDDGLKEHFATVTPMLAERGIHGLFFISTACLEEGRVPAVHKNHFLMAAIDFEEYRRAVLDELRLISPGTSIDVDPAKVSATYRWDAPDVAAFKYLLNFCVTESVREQILDRLFEKFLGAETKFASELYVSWNEARLMQDAGMVIGGHSHRHTALALLDDAECTRDLETCTNLVHRYLKPQLHWPFSFPYGKRQHYREFSVHELRRLGYCCSFTSEVGPNDQSADVFALQRIDPKDLGS